MAPTPTPEPTGIFGEYDNFVDWFLYGGDGPNLFLVCVVALVFLIIVIVIVKKARRKKKENRVE